MTVGWKERWQVKSQSPFLQKSYCSFSLTRKLPKHKSASLSFGRHWLGSWDQQSDSEVIHQTWEKGCHLKISIASVAGVMGVLGPHSCKRFLLQKKRKKQTKLSDVESMDTEVSSCNNRLRRAMLFTD